MFAYDTPMTVIWWTGDMLDISLTKPVDASKTRGIDVELITLPLLHLTQFTSHWFASIHYNIIALMVHFKIYVSFSLFLHLPHLSFAGTNECMNEGFRFQLYCVYTVQHLLIARWMRCRQRTMRSKTMEDSLVLRPKIKGNVEWLRTKYNNEDLILIARQCYFE